MGITVQRSESTPIPAGLYGAIVESVEPVEGNYGPQLKVKFSLQEEGYEERTLTGWASRTFTPKSKLTGWIRAALFGGNDVPESYKIFDTDHLIGCRVLLNVTIERGTDSESYNKIRDVLPLRHNSGKPVTGPLPLNAQSPAMQPRATGPAPSRPSEPPDWPGWDESMMADPGPAGEDAT